MKENGPDKVPQDGASIPKQEGPRDPMAGLRADLLEKRTLLDTLGERLIAISNQRLGDEQYGTAYKTGVPMGFRPTEAAAEASKFAAVIEVSEALREYRKELGSLSMGVRMDIKQVPEGERARLQSLLDAFALADKAAFDWSQDPDVAQIEMRGSTEGLDADKVVDKAIRNVGREASNISSIVAGILR